MKMFSLLAGALVLAASLMVGAMPAHAADFGSAASGLSMLGFAGSVGLAGSHRLAMTALERAKGRFLRGPDGHPAPPKSAAELAAETKSAFDAKFNEVKGLAEELKGKIDAKDTGLEALVEKFDGAFSEMNQQKARLDDVEQKLARDTGRGEDGMTAGDRFVNDDRFKEFAGQTRPRGRVQIDVKDISSLTTNASGSVGTLVQPERASPVELPQRRMTIRALLAAGTTSSGTIEYDREVGFTNNAATVAEGTSKPQSEIQFSDEIAKVATIAHWMRANVQILDDAPGLKSIIDNRLRYGLAFKEEAKLLNGPGGSDIEGLVTAATAYAAPSGLVADQLIDTIRYAMLQVALAEYPANGIVLNPIDWAVIETLKDANGVYLVGNPRGTLSPTLWSLPVVPTQAMTEDKFLVGAFDLAAQIFDRQNATVEASTEDGDNFTKNKVTIRAEERLALAIYRPEALVYGDLGRVA